MNAMKFRYYTDPGHGWVAVSRSFLKTLGVAHRVSSYSYQRGGTVYLEEDCDAGLVVDALRALGVTYTLDERHTDRRHPIRSYDHYRP